MDFADGGRQSGSDSTNDQAIPNDGPPQAPTHPQIAEQPPSLSSAPITRTEMETQKMYVYVK